MKKNDDLFTEAYARKGDPETSHEASSSVELSDLENTVFKAIKTFGEEGATSEQIADYLNLSLVTVSPRFRPLANKKRIAENPKEPRRCNKSGRRAIVWVATSGDQMGGPASLQP